MQITSSRALSVPPQKAAARPQAAPSTDTFQPKEKGFMERVGDRFKYAGKQGAYGAGFAVATYVAPFAVTSAISYLIPQWAPFGGMVANLGIGATVGAAIALSMDNAVNGPAQTKEAKEDRYNTMLHGACFGAIGGFLGVAASPAATTNWLSLGQFSGVTVGTTAGLLAGTGFVHGLWKGPAH